MIKDNWNDWFKWYTLYAITTITATKGVAGVQAYFMEEEARYATRLNCWQHVMFQTLAANAWFADGGYLAIPQ